MFIVFPLQQWWRKCALMSRYMYHASLVNYAFLQRCFLNCGPRKTAASLEVSMTTKIYPLAFTGNFVTYSSAVLSMVILWAQLAIDSTRRCLKKALFGNTKGRERFVVQLDITQILRQPRRKAIRVLDHYMWQMVGIKYFICFILLYSFPDPIWISPCIASPNVVCGQIIFEDDGVRSSLVVIRSPKC
jgi:hypothetical protein